MIKQNNPMMPKAIQIWGCYFCSVLYLAEVKRQKFFQVDEAIAIYKSAMATGIVGKEVFDKDGNLIDGCFVNDPVSLFALCGVEVGTVTRTGPEYKCAKGEHEILCYHRPANTPSGMGNKEHTHFVAGYNGGVSFDPLGDSNTVRHGYLKSKRVFR